MRKLFPWLRSHPILSILGGITVFFVAGHFFLNWRAERRWQAYAEAARARGVKLYLTEFAPPEIRDEENFAALPMMRAAFSGGKTPMELPPGDHPNFGDPRKGEHIDWIKWQTFFKEAGFVAETTDSPPRDTLRALEHYAPQFQEWSEWKTRTKCSFPLNWMAGGGMQFPHLKSFADAGKLFALRMRAHLAIDESSEAYLDFSEAFQAHRAMIEEPTLICGLACINALTTSLDGIGSGLADHSWKEPELGKIADDIASVEIWKTFRFSMEAERGFADWIVETLLNTPHFDRSRQLRGLAGPGGAAGTVLIACIPRRIYRDNQLRMNRYFDELLAQVRADGKSFDPNALTPSGAENLSSFDIYYYFLLRLTLPIYGPVATKFASARSKLDQTRLAVAIERFRIANGTIPKTLAELVPDFIPELPGAITREPLIYRPKESGSFLLYSVGPNRKDDAGSINPEKSEQSQPDWVWPYSRD